MPILNKSKVLTAIGLFYAAAPHAPYRAAALAPKSAMPLILYQRDDCHLCDLALEVLAAARAPAFDSVFIEDDAELQQRYGMRVPVLHDSGTGKELDWPFGAEQLRCWLTS